MNPNGVNTKEEKLKNTCNVTRALPLLKWMDLVWCDSFRSSARAAHSTFPHRNKQDKVSVPVLLLRVSPMSASCHLVPLDDNALSTLWSLRPEGMLRRTEVFHFQWKWREVSLPRRFTERLVKVLNCRLFRKDSWFFLNKAS